MNCHAEFEQVEIKCEEKYLPITEIKTEPQDIQTELKTEAEKYTTANEIHPIHDPIATVKTISKVDNTEKYLEKLLEDYEKESQKNTEQHKLIFPLKEAPIESYCTNLQEEKSSICEHRQIEEKVNTCNTYNSGKICRQRADNCVKSKKNPFTRTNEKSFTCNICNASFSRKYTLTKHLRTHTNVKPFTCDICSMSFSQKYPMTQHLRMHSNEKPFTCNICNKAFSRKGYLTQHLRTHTNERPYKCNICSKSFNQKSNLNDHLRSHQNEKQFTCNTCNKSFALKYYLKEHLRSHAVLKSFTCNYCSKSFSREFSLNWHLLIYQDHGVHVTSGNSKI